MFASAIIILIIVAVLVNLRTNPTDQKEVFSESSMDFERDFDDFVCMDIISDGELDGDFE